MEAKSNREVLIDMAYAQPFVPAEELMPLLMNAADTAERIAYEILNKLERENDAEKSAS